MHAMEIFISAICGIRHFTTFLFYEEFVDCLMLKQETHKHITVPIDTNV